MDGGRAIFGEESFRVCGLQAGRDLVMVQRTAASTDVNIVRSNGRGESGVEIPEAIVDVTIGGEPWQRLRFRPEPGWHEQVYRMSGQAVRPPCASIELRGRYASFHYWFFQ